MTTALAFDYVRPMSVPQPTARLVPIDHVHDAVTRAMLAERDLASARLRNRTLLRALNDLVTVSEPIATIRGTALVAPFLAAARTVEAFGEVPVLRFARDAAGVIVGIELALIEREDTGSAPLASPVEFGGMAVVGDDA
jgi:limonene-1,2-epoxide hydrolase